MPSSLCLTPRRPSCSLPTALTITRLSSYRERPPRQHEPTLCLLRSFVYSDNTSLMSFEKDISVLVHPPLQLLSCSPRNPGGDSVFVLTTGPSTPLRSRTGTPSP